MMTLEFSLAAVNRELLDEQLIAAAGWEYSGFRVRDGIPVLITVYLQNTAGRAVVDAVAAVAAAHSAAGETAGQKAERERRQKVEQARASWRGTALNPADYVDDVRLRVLAEQAAWLRAEIEALLGDK